MAEKTSTIPLIRTKLHRPPIPVVHVHRPQLLQRLEKGHPGPLTLISDPAGYVKNTLVSRWLEVCDCPNARISLDENNNLDLCLRYLLSAVQSSHGAGFPDAVHKALAWATAANLPTLTAGLVNRLKMIEQNFIPVLGDFQDPDKPTGLYFLLFDRRMLSCHTGVAPESLQPDYFVTVS